MSSRPWYPFYPADYLADTLQLTLVQDAIYRRYLDYEWLHGSIPLTSKERAKAARIHHHQEKATWHLLQGYFASTPSGYVSSRLEREREKSLTISKRRAEAAKARWDANADANAMLSTITVKNTPPIPPQGGEEREPVNGHSFLQRFDEFWDAYPRKVGKKHCKAKWRARKLDDMADALIADVKQRVEKDSKWRDGFIPNPLTYLNGDRWEDELADKGNGRWSRDGMPMRIEDAI